MGMIVGVTGRRGAGKSEAARLLRERGFEIVAMGAILRQMMVDRGIEPEEHNLRAFILDVRAELGEEVLAIETLEKINRMRSPKVAIIGIRTPAEINFFKRQFGNNLVTIAVMADDKTRFDRVRMRGRADDPRTRNEFMEYKNKIESKLQSESFQGRGKPYNKDNASKESVMGRLTINNPKFLYRLLW